MSLPCHEDKIDYSKIRKKEQVLVFENDKLIYKGEGEKYKVIVPADITKDSPPNSLLDIHTHTLNLPLSDKDIYQFLSNRKIRELCAILPSKEYFCAEKQDLTTPPVMIGSKINFIRGYNRIARELIREKGITKTRDIPQLEFQEKILNRLSERHNFKVERGKCSTKIK